MKWFILSDVKNTHNNGSCPSTTDSLNIQSLPFMEHTFCVTYHDKSINLSNAFSGVELSPLDASDQPKNTPYGLGYHFHTIFMEITSWLALKKIIEESLPRSDFISCREHCNVSSHSYPLHRCCLQPDLEDV